CFVPGVRERVPCDRRRRPVRAEGARGARNLARHVSARKGSLRARLRAEPSAGLGASAVARDRSSPRPRGGELIPMTIASIVHGHFYQPPRESPWTGSVDREPSAAPFHDWNERIDSECYRANAFARIVDDRNRVEHIVNNYLYLSFNF